MGNIVTLPIVKAKLHITTDNRNSEVEGCIEEAESEFNNLYSLLTNGSQYNTIQDPSPQLILYVTQYAVARYYFYNLPNHPTEATEQAKKSLKDYIRAQFMNQTDDGTAHDTFRKTSGAVYEGHGL